MSRACLRARSRRRPAVPAEAVVEAEEATRVFGNNLSFPIVFADGYGLTWTEDQRNLAGRRPVRHAADVRLQHRTAAAVDRDADGVPVLRQQHGGVHRRASRTTRRRRRARGRPSGATMPARTMEVIVDWGDALLSKTYTVQSMVRIETILIAGRDHRRRHRHDDGLQDGAAVGVGNHRTAGHGQVDVRVGGAERLRDQRTTEGREARRGRQRRCGALQQGDLRGIRHDGRRWWTHQ